MRRRRTSCRRDRRCWCRFTGGATAIVTGAGFVVGGGSVGVSVGGAAIAGGGWFVQSGAAIGGVGATVGGAIDEVESEPWYCLAMPRLRTLGTSEPHAKERT